MAEDRCRLALAAIHQAESGNMQVWKGRPDLFWLRYLYATRQNDYNQARYPHLTSIDSRESLQYTRRTLEHLDCAAGNWTEEERDTAALVLCWAEAAKGGMPRERKRWQEQGVSLVDHGEGSAFLYLMSLGRPPTGEEGAVSLLIRLHGALGQYLQGEISPGSGTQPFASPEGLSELESLCQKSGYPFSRFCRELALVSRCVLAGVSPQLAERYCNAWGALAAGQRFPALSPARRAERLCGGPVRLSPQAEELLQRRDLWYADGVLRAMGTLRGPAFLDALAASLPLEEPPVRSPAETFLSWHPGPMLSLKSLQERLYFYATAEAASGERRTDHCILAMVERAIATGRFSPTSHIAFSFARSGEEIALQTSLTPIGEAIDQFYQALVMSDITHNRAILAVFDQLGYRPDIFARVGNEEQYLAHMNNAADDKRRLLDFIRDGDRVLDVGPGGGVLLELIGRERPRCALAGADISAEVCQRLQQRAEAEGLPWQVLHGDFLALDPKETGSFDTIVFCSIIHEIFSYTPYQGRRFNKAVIPKILETASALLSPGGRVIIRDGVAAEQNPPVLLEFLDEELEALAQDYLRQFQGFPLLAQTPKETGIPHLYRLPQNSMMELLYTVTWGRESLPFEVEEWYGYYSQEDWQQLAAALSAPGGPGLRLVYFTQYLQPGYVVHLAERVRITGEDGRELPFPNSNMIAVFQKEE